MMFAFFRKTRKNTNRKLKGCITSVTDHSVTVKLSTENIPYKSGQRIIVSIPHERKTASGKDLKVSAIVALGEIESISRNTVVIQSKRTNPIISKAALRESKLKEIPIFVEEVY